MSLKPFNINKSWTLFLDRDGVINKRIVDSYVKSWNEFAFLPGSKEAILGFNKLFQEIIIVSNQQGVAKGIMSKDEVENVHFYLKDAIVKDGGHISKTYFAPEMNSDENIMRKPGVGMALKAQYDFPNIDFKKSIMVGDSSSDINFGSKLGMVTVLILGKENKKIPADLICNSLFDFYLNLKEGYNIMRH